MPSTCTQWRIYTWAYAQVNLLCALVNFAPAGPYTKFAN